MVVFPFVLLAAAPAIARFGHDTAMSESGEMPLLAAQVERAWRAMTPRPLRFVGGETLAYGVAAYASDRPRALPGLPAPEPAVLKRDGLAFVCLAEDATCVTRAKVMAQAEPQSRTIESAIARNVGGRLAPPRRYTIVLVPPAR